MLDGVLVLNQVIDFAKRNKKGCSIMKVDFEKTYDCVSWDFLRYVFGRMGFGQKWISWMQGTMFSILSQCWLMVVLQRILVLPEVLDKVVFCLPFCSC